MLWTEAEVTACRPGFMGLPMLADRLRLWRRSRKVLTVGGVLQRARPAVADHRPMTHAEARAVKNAIEAPLPYKAFVVPATGRKCELDAEDGTVCRIIDPVFRPMHVAKGQTDAEIIDCITALWRPTPEGT